MSKNENKNETIQDETLNEQTENQTADDVTEVEAEEIPATEEETTPAEPDFEAKAKEWQDKYLRLSAEFDNYRKRTLKEKMDIMKTAGEDILRNLLTVIDNFERALKSMETSQDVVAVKEGIDLIYSSFKAFLAQRGVKEIEAQDKDFDTDLHEAVTKIPVEDKSQKGKVVDVIERGYILNEKVIRYAKVVVGD